MLDLTAMTTAGRNARLLSVRRSVLSREWNSESGDVAESHVHPPYPEKHWHAENLQAACYLLDRA